MMVRRHAVIATGAPLVPTVIRAAPLVVKAVNSDAEKAVTEVNGALLRMPQGSRSTVPSIVAAAAPAVDIDADIKTLGGEFHILAACHGEEPVLLPPTETLPTSVVDVMLVMVL